MNTTKPVSDFFQFPKGEQVQEVLLLTYSMNLRFFNEIILKCGVLDRATEKNSKSTSECLHHITCIMQENRAVRQSKKEYETQYGYAYSALQQGRILFVPYKGASFHPKIWAFLYTKEEKTCLRLVIGSRNLTGQQMREGFLCLDGEVPDHKQPVSQNEPLLEMISSILVGHPLKKDPSVVKMMEAIQYTDFTPCIQRICDDDEYATYQFLSPQQGLNQAILDSTQEASSFVAVSPFLGFDKVEKVLNTFQGTSPDPCKKYTLLTQKASYTDEYKNKNIPLHYIKKTTQDRELELLVEHDFEEDEQPLHGKIYGFDGIACTPPTAGATESHLYIGSANFSTNGFEKNYEIMVKLVSQSKTFGITLKESMGVIEPITEVQQGNEDTQREGEDFSSLLLSDEEREEVLNKLWQTLEAEREEDSIMCQLQQIFNLKSKASQHPFEYAVYCLRELPERGCVVLKSGWDTVPNEHPFVREVVANVETVLKNLEDVEQIEGGTA